MDVSKHILQHRCSEPDFIFFIAKKLYYYIIKYFTPRYLTNITLKLN